MTTTPERHYDDAKLIAMVSADATVAAHDLHLRTCHTCVATLESLRAIPSELSNVVVWSGPLTTDEPRRETVVLLRVKQAEMWVKRLLARPREEWSAMITAHPAWCTDEMVGAMLTECDRLTYAMPPDARELARLAVELSSPLSVARRFEALREYAYTLYYTGAYVDALTTAQQAEAMALDDLSRARMQLQRALIISEMGDRVSGRDLARDAAKTFQQLGDNARFVAARRTEAMALYYLKQHRAALEVYSSVADLCTEPLERAGLLQNMALCHRELRDFAAATSLFTRALECFQKLGLSAAIAKTRWHLGRVFLLQGKYDDALKTLTSVRDEFVELAMAQDVALITIDIAQVLGIREEHAQVVELCQSAADYFRAQGIAGCEGSLVGLALIREAAASGSLSSAVLLQARKEIERRSPLTFAFVAE